MKPPRDLWLLFLLLGTHLYLGNEFRAFANPNVHSRVYLTLAIADHGAFAIDRCIERYGPVQDIAVCGGHTFSDKPPGHSVILAPIAWIIRNTFGADADARTMAIWLRTFGISIPAALFWYFTRGYWIAQAGDRRLGLSVLLAGALGTNFFIYSTQLFSHALAGILIFLALRDATEQSIPRAARCGFFLAVALTIDYIVAPAVLVLTLIAMFVRRRYLIRAGGAMLATSLPIALCWMAYNRACFDSLVRFSYLHHADAQYRPLIERGWLGMYPPRLSGILGLTVLPPHGLFILSPFLAIAPIGWCRMRSAADQRGPAAACTMTFLATLIFAATLVDWRGGWSVSARYLAPTVPLLMIGVAAAVRAHGTRASRWFLRAFAAIGIIQVTVIALTFPDCAPIFRNPPYDLAIPLLRAGCFNGVLWNSAITPAALIPFAAAMAAVAVWILLPNRWPGFLSVAIVIAAQWLAGAHGDYGRDLMLADAMWRMGYYCQSDTALARLHANTLAHDPNNLFDLRQLTWLRAASPCDDVRDPVQAKQLADHLVSVAGAADADAQDASAAAYAASGDFDAAVLAINRAIAAASRSENQVVLKQMADRRAAYKAGKAWRRPVVGR